MTGRPLLALPVLAAVALAGFWLFPGYLALMANLFVLAGFALSYDLLQGHAGVVSLGHAVFFGVGAYTAAILSGLGVAEPLIGLVAAALLCALLAALLSRIVVVGGDFTRLLVTLGVGALFHEAANKMHGLTGGADGLSGFDVRPIAGLFAFDFAGRTAFFYTLAVLVFVYLAVWRVTTSPFGLALRGIRENALRMQAVGAPLRRYLTRAYVISGALAGMTGAALAEISDFASIDMLGFERSADAMIMTAIGGSGSLPGVVVGAALYEWLEDRLSAISPEYWRLGLGLAMMASVFVFPRGLAGLASLRRRKARP